MDESFVLASDEFIDEQVNTLSEKMADTLSGGKLKASDLESANFQLSLGVAKILKTSYGDAEAELEAGQRLYLPRSFAVDSGFSSRISDFYARYIPILSMNMSLRNFMNIQKIIKRGEEKGLSQKEIQEDIAVSYSGLRGSGSVIVRTEGTRASALARRALAHKSNSEGKGPDFFIYKALRDTRTTKTCKKWHNFYWSIEDDELSYHPPMHFYCRAGVVYGWKEGIGKEHKKLTPLARKSNRDLQKSEFPGWTQQGEGSLISPVRGLRNRGADRIIDDSSLEYAIRQTRDIEKQIGKSALPPGVREMISEMTKRRIDPKLRDTIERELAKEISKKRSRNG